MKRRHVVYLLIICLVSVFDVYISLLYESHIVTHEENMMSRTLIRQYGLHNFVIIKSIMTVFAVSVMILLTKTKYRVAIFWVALFQMWLFLYLNFHLSDIINFRQERLSDNLPINELIESLSK